MPRNHCPPKPGRTPVKGIECRGTGGKIGLEEVISRQGLAQPEAADDLQRHLERQRGLSRARRGDELDGCQIP